MAVHNEDDDFHNDDRFFPLPIPSEFEDTTYTTPPSPLFDTTIPRPTSAPEPHRAQQQEPRLKRTRTPSNGKYDSDTYASILSTLARHSRKRSASRASESGSLSALLVITNERLSQETARANALQVQTTNLEAAVRTHVTTVAGLRQELAAVREELRLYKLQLETANREIARAQNVCDSVERARVDAEDRARRDRDRVRRYAEQLEVERARDEGYEHGLREGMSRAAGVSSWRRFVPRRGYTDPAGTARREDVYTPPGSVTSSGSLSGPSSRYVIRTPARGPSNDGFLRGSGARKPAVPPSEIVSPTPMRAAPVPAPPRAPSSSATTRPFSRPRSHSQPVAPQDHRPPTRQEGRGPSRQETRPPTRQGSAKPTRQPEDINVYPIPYVPSPTPSKRSIVLPPDGYIPVFDEETQSILMPPPHELSRPNPVDDAEEQVVFSPRQPSVAPPEDYFSHEPTRLTRRRDSEPRPRQTHAFPMRTRTMSDASTTISQYDLLRHGDGAPGRSPIPHPPPPPSHPQPTEEEKRRRSDELVREWQAHNAEAEGGGEQDAGPQADPRRGNVRPPSRLSALSTFSLNGFNPSVSAIDVNMQPPAPRPPQQPPQMPAPAFDRPPTRERAPSQERQRTPSVAPRPPSVMSHQSRGPPPTNGPRTKPRRIVLPQPLTTYSSSAPYVPTLKSQNLPPAPSMPPPPINPAPPQQPSRQRTPSQAPPPSQYQPAPQYPPALSQRAPRDTPNSHSGSSGSNSKRASVGAWLKNRFQRSSTSSTVPQIAIEPPSVPASESSASTVRDELLLSPDHAPTITLPDDLREPRGVESTPRVMSPGLPQGTSTPVIELPNGELPPGFVPRAISPLQG
ncbi:hypothetical protein HDZ31DRAFT_61127 [Schizophyllum fasciatum]